MLSIIMLSFLAAASPADPVGRVIIRLEPAFEYLFTDHLGDYAAIPQAIQDFMAEFFKRGLKNERRPKRS